MGNSKHTNSTLTDCDALTALIPAYVIGAADPEETRFVERYLQDCPEAVAELRAYTDIQDAMLLATPVIEPPAALAAELRHRIDADQTAPDPHRSQPSQPAQRPQPHPADTVPVPPMPTTTLPSLMPRTTAPSRRSWLTAAVAAVLMLLFVSNLFWMAQNTRMMQEMQAAQRMRIERNSAIAALSAGDARMTPLHDPTHGSMSGTMIWSSQKQMAMISVANLPKTTSDQEYQLWFMTGDEEISMGTFRVQDDGMGMMIFDLSQPVENFNAFGVTLEPVGGSTTPTTSPVLMGTMENP